MNYLILLLETSCHQSADRYLHVVHMYVFVILYVHAYQRCFIFSQNYVFIRSFIHLLTRSFVCSLVRSLGHSFIWHRLGGGQT